MEVVKIGILGVAGVMLALQFKSIRPEISVYIGLAIGLIIFVYTVDGLFELIERMETLQKYMETGGSYFKLLFKAVGVTYICEFAASICKDAGYGTVAGQIEIFGKLTVLFMGMPVLMSIIENISTIAG
ncbi:MAG: stage III sporulation protein AD [Lachnospiraceae bacterium]|nr:stage III sporulation protein AD [Lachnospiraceae bacterium]